MSSTVLAPREKTVVNFLGLAEGDKGLEEFFYFVCSCSRELSGDDFGRGRGSLRGESFANDADLIG